MIDNVIAYVRRELRDFLGVQIAEVVIGNIPTLKENNNARGVYLSLVNVEEETTLKNTSHVVRQNNNVRYQEPPAFLNLFLLFAFDFEDYEDSVRRLSQTVELFQHRRVLSPQNANVAFPANVEKLVFELFNLDLEHLNHLWGVLGGAYFPSLLYKVRMVRIQRDETLPAPEIQTIQVDTSIQ